MAAGAAKWIMEGAGSIGKLGGEALGKIVNSFTGKAGSEAAEQTAKATSKEAASFPFLSTKALEDGFC